MKERDKFRYAEKCLYEYKRNVAGLKVLREDLRVAQAGLDVKAQSYQLTFGFEGEVRDPVHQRLVKIESLESKIQWLKRQTDPIGLLIEDLSAPEVLEYSDNKGLLDILRLLYFGRNPADIVIEELKLARRTFYNRRRELVNMAISYLAL
jgi:hypothetical protein